MPIGDGIQVDTDWRGEVDVRIAGSLNDLYLLSSGTHGQRIDVDISGDIDLGRPFTDIFSRADVDLADILSRHIGDLPSQFLHQKGTSCWRFIKRSANSLSYSMGEYMREEISVTPNPLEIQHLINQVDELRDACANFQERLNRYATSK